MFNLKMKFSNLMQSTKNVINLKDPQVIIAEIHESFDTASEKLLVEAKRILSGKWDIEKGERLKKVGFVSAKKAVEATEITLNKKNQEELATKIEYFQTYYPNNKFITEEKVKEICQKYGLLCAETEYYISDVPEKNLKEIENFKLRDEDAKGYICGWFRYSGNGWLEPADPHKGTYGYADYNNRTRYPQIKQVSEDQKYHYESNPMKICASIKDFDTKNMKIEDGYKLSLNLPDPIVLQPVTGGYLVVSKWGLEAEDSELVNEKLN